MLKNGCNINYTQNDLTLQSPLLNQKNEHHYQG
jgi:hypothetical protein